ncbi:MAG TPA: carboxynorspermidine decarboxylase, partial [Mobilitalea sp.]|nr:carboxynorspermidine decarboxylase [Mobilitalea sp.]
MNIDFSDIPTPSYVVDEGLLIKNLELLKSVIDQTGCEILLAQKAFSMYSVYPLIAKYLSGTTASSLFEAKLGHEEMGKEVHIFSPCFREEEFDELMNICDHIVFNSLAQWNKYKNQVFQHNEEVVSSVGDGKRRISCGLRINPEYSEIETELYDPCAINSRFGVTATGLRGADLSGIEGLHFHTMCEQNSDVLERTLKVVEDKFSPYLADMRWMNFGGGHHITREGYDIESLIRSITRIKKTYGVQVYLEPGEAIALNSGWLVSSVLDLMENGMQIAIMDTSASCHMPDVLEMPYRPIITGSGEKGEHTYTYRLGGPTCLAG